MRHILGSIVLTPGTEYDYIVLVNNPDKGIGIETMGLKMPTRPTLLNKWGEWTPEHADAMNRYDEAIYRKFRKVTDKFDWR